jgi:tRNA nucleotidyltransferase/poly(A) polymerase
LILTAAIVRFAGKYGFKIDDETWEGMKRNIDELQFISKERIRDELDKIIVLEDPTLAMEMLKDIGALKYIYTFVKQKMQRER